MMTGSIVIVLEVGGGHYAGTEASEMAWAAKYEGQTAPNCGDGTPTPEASDLGARLATIFSATMSRAS